MADKRPTTISPDDIQRLITGHAVNNTGDSSKNATHAYQVALKTLRDRCQKQAEQLRQLDDETRRLIRDKASLHEEIERLRENTSRHRERTMQLNREMAGKQRECSGLREQVALQSRQLQAARRRLEAAGLDASDVTPVPSIEQTCRGTTEVDVQVEVASPEETSGDVHVEDISALSEKEVGQRLLEQHQAHHQSLQETFHDVLTELQRATVSDNQDISGASLDLRQMAEVIKRHNQALRSTVQQLLQLPERKPAVVPPAAAGPHVSATTDSTMQTAPLDPSLPPLHEIPLGTSPPSYSAVVPTPAAGGAAGAAAERADGATDPPCWPAGEHVCPLCNAIFRPPATRAEFEDHVYAHLEEMVPTEGLGPATLVGL